MFFHHDKAGGQYYVRQSDIPKGVVTERVDVPTDANGLAVYLSAISQPPVAVPAPDQIVVTTPVGEVAEVAEVFIDDKPIRPPMNAIALLSRVDSPGVNVEGVIEAIAKARGYALARYAGAIAIRYHELEKL